MSFTSQQNQLAIHQYTKTTIVWCCSNTCLQDVFKKLSHKKATQCQKKVKSLWISEKNAQEVVQAAKENEIILKQYIQIQK